MHEMIQLQGFANSPRRKELCCCGWWWNLESEVRSLGRGAHLSSLAVQMEIVVQLQHVGEELERNAPACDKGHPRSSAWLVLVARPLRTQFHWAHCCACSCRHLSFSFIK